MATKKTATGTKKSVKRPAKRAASSARTTTKVTTSRAATASRGSARRFSFSRSPLLAASVAEFVGTFLLAAVVLASAGSAVIVFFGLVAVVLAVGLVSGSHLNPAITLGAWATRRVNSVRALSYVIAQVLGALLALVVVNSFVVSAPEVSEQAAMFGQQAPSVFSFAEIVEGKEWLILAAELLGTAIFAFIFAAATRGKDRLVSAFGIGGGYFVGLAIAGYLVSVLGAQAAVLNPALAGSLQAISWDLWAIVAYVLAPVIGAVVGFALQDLVANEGGVRA